MLLKRPENEDAPKKLVTLALENNEMKVISVMESSAFLGFDPNIMESEILISFNYNIETFGLVLITMIWERSINIEIFHLKYFVIRL